MDDSQIIALFFERSQDAIAESANKYGRLCHSVANGILSSFEEAEECVNDTYMRAWSSIPPQKPTRLAAFFCKITRNLALDRLSARRREKRGGYVLMEELHDALPSGDTADTLTDEIVLKNALNTFLRGLSPKTRAVFLGRYFYCLSVKELSGSHSMTESNVKTLLHRTRLALKAHLEHEGIVL